MGFAGFLKQSTAVDVLIGPFVDATDGDTEETGLTIASTDVLLSKLGQGAAAKNDATAAAHDADGFYNCELDATDTDTVGTITLYVHVAGALAVRHDFQILEEAIYDDIYGTGAALAKAAALATVQSDTDDIQTRLPAALVSGAMDSDVSAMQAGVVTAAAIATDAVDADALAADAVTEIWAKAMVEPTGVPAVTGTVLVGMSWLLAMSRNKILQTATTSTLRNDADGADIATSTVSSDGTTFTKGEWA